MFMYVYTFYNIVLFYSYFKLEIKIVFIIAFKWMVAQKLVAILFCMKNDVLI